MVKALLVILVIAILGTFIYVEVEVSGDPGSSFNQTTRFTLGEHPVLRTIFGLHNVGDARGEYLEGSGPITIEWFAPTDSNVDQSVLQQFAGLVAKYTGQQVVVLNGGGISDGTVQLSNLDSFKFKADAQKASGGSVLAVFFLQDYSPRQQGELSTTYNESSMVISLNALSGFLTNYQQDTDEYLLGSLVHEFGNQIGLKETSSADSLCIMNLHAGINGQPLEVFGKSEPQDFCAAERQEIGAIKLQLSS